MVITRIQILNSLLLYFGTYQKSRSPRSKDTSLLSQTRRNVYVKSRRERIVVPIIRDTKLRIFILSSRPITLRPSAPSVGSRSNCKSPCNRSRVAFAADARLTIFADVRTHGQPCGLWSRGSNRNRLSSRGRFSYEVRNRGTRDLRDAWLERGALPSRIGTHSHGPSPITTRASFRRLRAK